MSIRTVWNNLNVTEKVAAAVACVAVASNLIFQEDPKFSEPMKRTHESFCVFVCN